MLLSETRFGSSFFSSMICINVNPCSNSGKSSSAAANKTLLVPSYSNALHLSSLGTSQANRISRYGDHIVRTKYTSACTKSGNW